MTNWRGLLARSITRSSTTAAFCAHAAVLWTNSPTTACITSLTSTKTTTAPAQPSTIVPIARLGSLRMAVSATTAMVTMVCRQYQPLERP
jgi:hypothetical protein